MTWYLLIESLFRTTICTKFTDESLSDTAFMILTQYKNNIQIVIFRELPWGMISYRDKKNFLFNLRSECVSKLAVLAELIMMYLL